MQFDKKEIAVAADCTEVEITLKHTGKLPAQAMGHNWVLTKTADLTPVATDGMGAGFANDHVKPGDARVIASHENRRRRPDDVGEVPDVEAQERRGIQLLLQLPRPLFDHARHVQVRLIDERAARRPDAGSFSSSASR